MSELKQAPMSVGLAYRDPRAALQWLEAAFGFETVLVVLDDTGGIAHSEMRLGQASIMVGGEWDERHRSPASVGGINTQSVHIQIETDVDAHCERARKAGATVIREPSDEFYGDRRYDAADPEGHIWSFARTQKAMSMQEMEQASGGLKLRTSL